jgi:hypothetical protein
MHLIKAAGLVAVLFALFGIACVGGDSSEDPTPTIASTATPILPTTAFFESLERPAVGGILAYVDAPSEQAMIGGEVKASIWVRGVEGLGAFRVQISDSSSSATLTYVVQGSFLGSTGREVDCDPAEYLMNTATLLCLTLGAQPSSGASGEGELIQLTFKTSERAPFEVRIDEIEIVSPDGFSLATAQVTNGRFRIE